jgi:hypothetical protein
MKCQNLVVICIITLAVVNTACNKVKGPDTGNYIGNFWGKENYTVIGYEFNLVEIPLYFEKDGDNILVNSCSSLNIENDSVFGFICVDDSAYKTYPFIAGVWDKRKKEYVISGTFAAVCSKDSMDDLPINGTFEISSDN